MASQSGLVSGIAGRYANALYDLADEQKALDQVADDLRALRGMLAESEDLRRLVQSPVLKRDVQARALAAVVERAGFSQLTRNFIGIVARHRRLFALSGMIEGFLRVLASRRGEVTAEVTAARPLTDSQRAALTEALNGVVSGKVTVDENVDPSLLGGLIVKVGSRMYDSSLRSKLQRMQLAMKGA